MVCSKLTLFILIYSEFSPLLFRMLCWRIGSVQQSKSHPRYLSCSAVSSAFMSQTRQIRSIIAPLFESVWAVTATDEGVKSQTEDSGCRTASSNSLMKCLRSSRQRSRISPRFSLRGTCSCFSKLGSFATSIFTTIPKVSQS